MINISGFGLSIVVIAISSFPNGFALSEFADDTDPLTVDQLEPTGYEQLYDGSLFFYDKTAPIKVSVSVIPGSADDTNLKILLQGRKGSPPHLPIPDITSMVITYPDGGIVGFSKGSIVSGPLSDTVQSAGRKKSNTYDFIFDVFAGAQSPLEIAATVARFGLSIGFGAGIPLP
jgi:hypothetical protein